jgi:hypothetical protein
MHLSWVPIQQTYWRTYVEQQREFSRENQKMLYLYRCSAINVPIFVTMPSACDGSDDRPNDSAIYGNTNAHAILFELQRYATIGTIFYAVRQCRMPDSNVEPESAWKVRDKFTNFSRLKPLIAWDYLLRSVLSTTVTNHSRESAIRKFLERDIHLMPKSAIEFNLIVHCQFPSHPTTSILSCEINSILRRQSVIWSDILGNVQSRTASGGLPASRNALSIAFPLACQFRAGVITVSEKRYLQAFGNICREEIRRRALLFGIYRMLADEDCRILAILAMFEASSSAQKVGQKHDRAINNSAKTSH